ncbi:MAG: hypothetical protein MZW92_32455 [Comamonadaceae bacterium]|nr:hypothetical protein [Comamonadaceae bacterium]
MIRQLRANLLDELQKQYVVTGRAKGLPPGQLLMKYPLRMALNPFIADIGRPPARADLGLGDRRGRAVAADHRADAARARCRQPGHVSRRLVPDVPGAADRGRACLISDLALAAARSAHPARAAGWPRNEHGARPMTPRRSRAPCCALRLEGAVRPAGLSDREQERYYLVLAVADDVAGSCSRHKVAVISGVVLALHVRLDRWSARSSAPYAPAHAATPTSSTRRRSRCTCSTRASSSGRSSTGYDYTLNMETLQARVHAEHVARS